MRPTAAIFAGRTYYFNGEDSLGLSYEREVRDDGTAQDKYYLSAGGLVFAMVNKRTSGQAVSHSSSYFHHDHLGSIAAITDETGAVKDRLAFDPWGKRRFILTKAGWPDTKDEIVGLRTDRGYTMHEHLDEVGVVHMNGRLYDPLIGRFMSADPFIQNAGDLQSYNRYAYVMNNPLLLTDPSGYFSFKKVFRTVLAIYVGYLTGGLVSGWLEMGGLIGGSGGTLFATGNAALTPLGSAVAGAAGGFASGAIGSGNLNGALQGALSGGLFGAAGAAGGAGELGAQSVERYAAHAAAGCVSSVAGGGKCGSGAASAVFGKFATNSTSGWGPVSKGVASVVAGGVGSVIAGGKFENGAVTAAYAYLFNYCSSGKCTSAFEQAMYDYWPGYKAGTLLYNQTMGDGSWTGWEVVDAVSVGAGAAAKGLSAGLSGGANSVFWSGHGAMEEAAALGTTLEKTPVGSVLNVLQQKGIGSRWVWGQASATFANNASGTAQAVIRYNNPASIFYRTELPILQRNGVLIQPR